MELLLVPSWGVASPRKAWAGLTVDQAGLFHLITDLDAVQAGLFHLITERSGRAVSPYH